MKDRITAKKARIINRINDRELWHIYHQLGAVAAATNRERNAAGIRKERMRCAPLPLLEMIF